jgi:Holliday junction resolvase-like predicted endonuclease
MKQHRRGTLSEKIAICYFVEKGLDVFDSCQCTGPVDLITFNPDTGEIKCWEVKTENYRLTGSRKGVPLSRARRNKKFTKIIHMIYINKEGKIREGKRK